MSILNIRRRAAKAETSTEVLEAVRELETAIKADEAALLDLATRRMVLLPTGTVDEIRAMDNEAQDCKVRLEQGRVNIAALKARAAELALAERLDRIDAALAEHNALVPEYIAAATRLAEIGAQLLPYRDVVEQAGRSVPGAPSLPDFPLMAFNLAALQSVRPSIQPPSELWTWEAGCRAAAETFARFRKQRKAA